MYKQIASILLLIIFHSISLASEDSTDICGQYISEVNGVENALQAPSEIPYGHGLLWKIEGQDGKISHLFGTMHSQDRMVTQLPPQVWLKLVQSQTLVMEVIQDQEANQVFLDSMYFTGTQNLNNLIDETIYTNLKGRIIEYGVNENDVPRLKPWAAFSILAIPRPVRAYTLDQVLMQKAAAANKTIVGMETMPELIAVLESISIDDQVEILNDTVCNHDQILQDNQHLVQLYVARDLAGIKRFSEQPHHDEAVFKRYIKTMVYDRNLHMIKKMEDYLKQGKAFVAVGATHLTGEKGLLKMLENKGYKITLVY